MTRAVALAVVAAMFTHTAHAYDRGRSPVAVAVARADAVVIAEVVEVEPIGRPIANHTVRIERSLHGELTGQLTVEVDQIWEVGQRVVLLVREVDGTWKVVLDGTGVHTPELEAEITRRLKHKPAWSEPADGWSAALVTTESSYAPQAEIDAYLVYRNTSDAPKTLAYREWPPEGHTYVDLTVRRGTAEVAPLAHPHVTKKDIAEYFSQHANTFEIELPPGESWALSLQRINSAKPGWGYKQRLNFRYWPMDASGTYTLSARDVGTGLHTPAITVEVK